jgi:hypothetical protein
MQAQISTNKKNNVPGCGRAECIISTVKLHDIVVRCKFHFCAETFPASAKRRRPNNINSNCTGSATITPKGLPPINLNLVVVSAGKEIMAVETDTNTIVAGTFLE